MNSSFFISIYRLLKSPLLVTLAFLCSGLFFLPIMIGVPLLILFLAFLVRFPYLLPKHLMYEVSLVDLMAREAITQRFTSFNQKWWHAISEELILGALPLSNRHHLAAFKELQIEAVCALLDNYEAEKVTPFSTPITSEEWKNAAISYCRFTCSDMQAIGLAQLDEIVAWIHSHTQKGKKVYLHCKAGRGRSAMAAVCYLMRYQDLSFESALERVRGKRSLINMRPAQLQRIKEFAAYLNNSNH